MSCAFILAILWTMLFTRSTGFLQDNKLPGPDELVQRSGDVIKGPPQDPTKLEGEGVCACPENNFCENLRCYKGVVCFNPEYVGLVTVAASVALLFVILSACLIAIYCTVRKPCGNICPCCCGSEDCPENRRRRQRQLSIREPPLQEVVSIGGSPNDCRVASGRTSSPQSGDRNYSDGKNGSSPGLQFSSPVPEGKEGGAVKSPVVGQGSDKKRKRKSVSSDEGDDDVKQENTEDLNLTTSENEVEEVTTSENEQAADDTKSADLTFGDSTANDSTRLLND